MGRKNHDQMHYTSVIEDLFDEQTDEYEEFEDISISSCVYEPVLVNFKGTKLESRLEKAFYPKYDREIFIKDADGKTLTLPLEDVQFLAFVNKPAEIETLPVNNLPDVIELFRGDSFTIHFPDSQNLDIGLFGITTNEAERYKYIFFHHNNIRIHYQKRRLGEIIIEKHLLTEDALNNVLSRQNHLRSLRLGSIIAKQANIKLNEIESTLKQAKLKKADGNKRHSGELLIEAGLVSPQVVQQSLAFQKKVRRMRVGKMLVDMGYINEDQVFKALAEKFRKRFVNLHSVSPDIDALVQLPQDLVRKLKVLPISFQNKRLIVATSYPDRAELSDILQAKLSCPFEIVVSPLNQIIDVMANLPSLPSWK